MVVHLLYRLVVNCHALVGTEEEDTYNFDRNFSRIKVSILGHLAARNRASCKVRCYSA